MYICMQTIHSILKYEMADFEKLNLNINQKRKPTVTIGLYYLCCNSYCPPPTIIGITGINGNEWE